LDVKKRLLSKIFTRDYRYNYSINRPMSKNPNLEFGTTDEHRWTQMISDLSVGADRFLLIGIRVIEGSA
jgi:hypothetical protein